MPSASRPGHRLDLATHQRWQQRLERFGHTGLTVAAFYDSEGISPASFYAWGRRLQCDSTQSDADPTRLVPVCVVIPPASGPVELVLPTGLVLLLPVDTDLVWLRRLLLLSGPRPGSARS
jgi:hypothetical protein